MTIEWHEDALALIREGKFDEAVKVAPEFPSAWFMRGVSKYNARDYEGAHADFSKAIELYPDELYSLQMRRDCSLALGRKEEAEADRARINKIFARINKIFRGK